MKRFLIILAISISAIILICIAYKFILTYFLENAIDILIK